MSGPPEISRYGLRKRPESDVSFHEKQSKQTRPSLPPADAPSGVARPTTPKTTLSKLRASTLTQENTPTKSQKQQPAPKPLAHSNFSPHQLTIDGRTFTGPLPPNHITDPSQNADPSGDHNNYILLKCEYCPIPEDEIKPHDLCYDSHPCLWSFPPKAKEAFANRNHWLDLDKPLESTRLPNGRLPRLLDEEGEPVFRGLRAVTRGVDVSKAYDEVVMRRYLAVVRDDECCEMRGVAEDDPRFEEYAVAHRLAREAMLEDMGWEFEW